MSNANQVVIVTGASSGIGRTVAEAYLARGASVVASGRDEAKLRSIAGPSDRLATVAGDIGEPSTAERLVRTARDRFGRLDVVVTSAGLFIAKPFVDFSLADLDAMVATNLRGTILTAQAAVRAWRELESPGSIVMISAAIALSPQRALPSSLPVAIKGSINALAKGLALELASENIRVNAVAPGIIRTPLIGANPDRFAGAQPIGHIGEPSDVTNAILYLASAPFVTGAVLPVDGGMSTGHW